MTRCYRRYFTVEGRGEFPFDMLRYDQCWPMSSEDVDIMITENRLDTRRVRMATDAGRKTGSFTTDARWASFRWTVVQEN